MKRRSGGGGGTPLITDLYDGINLGCPEAS
jgi:hypothetical protein